MSKCVLVGIHAPEEVLVSAPVRFRTCMFTQTPGGDSGNSGLEVFPKQDVLPDAIERLSAETKSGSSTPACFQRG